MKGQRVGNTLLLEFPGIVTAWSKIQVVSHYEHCRTSFDWLRAAVCFARRSWLQSAQTRVVRVERRADTPAGSRERHCTRARCILRAAVGPVAPAWCITAERAAQKRDTASRHARLAHPLRNHCERQHASDG